MRSATSRREDEDAEDCVHGTLQYLATADDGAASYIASAAGNVDVVEHDGRYRYQTVKIYNGRTRNDWSIHKEGFQLLSDVPTRVSDFHNDTELEAVYNGEVEALLLRTSGSEGATRIHVFDHTRRSSSSGERVQLHCREPSSVIHNDYTEMSAEKRLREILPDEADDLLRRRFAIVNVWRSIGGIVECWPLALCDSTSLSDRDLVPVRRVAKDRIGEIQMAVYNHGHKWYYFPRMTPEEALLIKTYDSALDGTNRFTIHTAFEDRSATGGVQPKPRQTIETRAFVFY